MYPDAPIYTSMYGPDRMHPKYRDWDIRTSFMQRLPAVTRHHQPYLPFYPFAFESFDLSEFDLVISNSSGFCHGVLTRPDATHVNYCLTPPRFVWTLPQYLAREKVGKLGRLLLPPLVSTLRSWDAIMSLRVDQFVAISRAISDRIQKYYRRDSEIIYPPVETTRFSPAPRPDDFFLIVSRLIPYKRVDLAVRAFNKLGLPLKIVGSGRDKAALESIAGPNIEFLGRVSDEEVVSLFSRCQAFLFPGEEDFGIAPLEAQAAGRPVIALRAGGAMETVLDGQTGVFFDEQTWESLIDAVKRFQLQSFQTSTMTRWAAEFDTSRFRQRFSALVDRKLAQRESRFAGLVTV